MTESDKKKEFTPRIVGFLCNWCTYAAADLAGSTKLEVSPALTVVAAVICEALLFWLYRRDRAKQAKQTLAAEQ